MNIILAIVLNSIEINYACIDQHVDAKFRTYEEALKYAEYYKPHHNYQIIAFPTFNIDVKK